jgi:hypothetical protein
MSLINDALKRATQAQTANAPTQEPQEPMQPVESRQGQGLPMYFTPVLLFVISGACWFLVRGWEAKRQAGFYPAPVTVMARESASSGGTVIEVPEPVKQDAVESLIPTHREFALSDTLSNVAAGEVSMPGPVEESKPAFRLQGIFYRPNNPSAVVNSKTVFVGDFISNGKVKAIDRQSVTIDLGGETKVLTLQ